MARAADFRAAWERRQAREDRLREENTALEALWKRRDDARNEAAALRTALGLTDAAPVEALQRRRSRWETLCQQQTALEGEIALLRQRLQAGTAAAGQPADREMAETGPLAALSRQRETLARAKAETVGALSQFPPAQVLAERLRQLERQEERIRWNCRAIQLAEAAVSEAQRQLRLNFAPELNDRAGRYLAAFTAGRYQEMLVSREFIPQARGAGMLEARGTPELSRGTGDQMYLALRLALCDMTLPQKPTLVLDDALVAFDEQRLAAVLEVLREKGRQQQILLFTCQQRESQMLAQAPEVTQIRLEAKE